MTLFTGTVLAQAIPFLAAPLIARLYDAPQFALYGAMLAVFNVLAVIAAGRYEMAIAVPREERTAADLVKGAVLIAVAVGAIGYGMLRSMHGAIERATGLPGLDPVIGMVALLTVLAGTQMAMQQWLLRDRAFKQIASAKVLQAVATTVLVLMAGWWGMRDGLPMAYVAGWTLFAAATVWFATRRRVLASGISLAGIGTALRDHHRYPMYGAVPAVINALASGAAVIYMTLFFNTEIAGQHNFTRQYLLVPLGMFTVALGQALYERVASRVRENATVWDELMVLIRRLVIVALGLVLVVMLLGPMLFTIVFGEQWSYAGDAARVLVWGYAAQLVSSPLTILLFAMGRVRSAVIFPVVYALLMIIPLFLPHLLPMSFMALLSGIEVVAYGLNVVVVLHHVRSYERSRTT